MSGGDELPLPIHCADVTCSAETLDPIGEGWIPRFDGREWICRRCAWMDMIL